MSAHAGVLEQTCEEVISASRAMSAADVIADSGASAAAKLSFNRASRAKSTSCKPHNVSYAVSKSAFIDNAVHLLTLVLREDSAQARKTTLRHTVVAFGTQYIWTFGNGDQPNLQATMVFRLLPHMERKITRK
jgi:hypothetical protein